MTWLDDLKPGDQVGVSWARERVSLHSVAKVTKTQVVLDTGDRYRRRDGSQIGASSHWGSWRLQDPKSAQFRIEWAQGLKREQISRALTACEGIKWSSGADALDAAAAVMTECAAKIRELDAEIAAIKGGTA